MSNYQFPEERTINLVAGECRARIVVNPHKLASVHGPRFDHLGLVRQVYVNGQKFLHSGGLGDEFGIHGEGVLGFGESNLRKEFIKIGIGRFKQSEPGDYTFWIMYPLVKAFPVHVEKTRETLTSSQDGEHGPYAYTYQKHYQLKESGLLEIHYTIKNTGEREFSFEDYNHNWIRMAQERPDEQYLFTPAFPIGTPPAEHFEQTTRGVKLVPMPQRKEWVCYHASDKKIPKAHNAYTVKHLGNGNSVSYAGDHHAERFALYTDRKGFCPEVFHRAEVKPGNQVQWCRKYHFRVK